MLTTTKRRSRRDATAIGNPPQIGPRDLATFLLLTRYRYLDSRQLWRLLPPDLRRETPNPNAKYSSAEIEYKRRLRRLRDHGYLFRSLHDGHPPRLSGNFDYRGYEIYEIGDAAVNHLAYKGIQEENITGHSVGATLQFPHALMICSTLASLEMGAVANGVRFITWPEILINAPSETRYKKHPWQFPEVEISYRFSKGTETEHVAAKPDSPPFGFEYPDGLTSSALSKRSDQTRSKPTTSRTPHGSARI